MGRRILLVEGDDDQHVMWNLFQRRDVPERFRVEQPVPERSADGERASGGDTVLLESLDDWLLESDLECLAVVLDADEKGVESRWQSIRHRLLNVGQFQLPQNHAETGIVVDLSLRPRSPRSIRFAAWIMPDNRSRGMLEDFVIRLIRGDDAMLARVDNFLNSIPSAECRFSSAHLPKARIHTWLAISERPGRPMGQAIASDKYIDVNHPSVAIFLDWVRRALVD